MRKPKFISFVINVLKKDIDNGEQGEASSCAIALAVQRQLDGLISKVEVDGLSAELWFEDRDVDFGSDYEFVDSYLPEKCDTFVTKFDDNKKSVKPFNFTLKIPLADLSEKVLLKLSRRVM